MTPAIEFVDVSRHYRNVIALRNASFEVPAGSITALLGPNGAGKTTATRIAAGLAKQNTGSVVVLDTSMPEDARLLRGRLGVSMGTSAAMLEASPVQIVRLAADYLGISLSSDAASEVLDRVGLAPPFPRRAARLSTGQRQRLSVALALLGNPELMILDEPTLGLDVTGLVHFRELIRDLVSGGVTVLLTTHDMAEVERLCEYVVMITDGRVVLGGWLGDLLPGMWGTRLVLSEDDMPHVAHFYEQMGVHSRFGAKPGVVEIEGVDPQVAGQQLASIGVFPTSMTGVPASLEELYLAEVHKELSCEG